MDLLYLDAEPGIIADYARSLTGLCLKTAYFRHVARTMKKNNMQRHYSPEKLSMLHEKIAGKVIYPFLSDYFFSHLPFAGLLWILRVRNPINGYTILSFPKNQTLYVPISIKIVLELFRRENAQLV